MKFVDDEVIFSSGTKAYAFANIIGINPELELSYGYDSSFDEFDLSKQDRCELADYMISLWQAFKDKA